MALRGFLPTYRTGIRKIFRQSFLMRKASGQARTSTGALSLTENLCITNLFQKNASFQINRNVTPALPTIGIPVKLPCVTERMNFEYRLPTLLVKYLIVNQDLPILIEKLDPLVNKWEIRTPNALPIIRKEAARMIQIRRRKMKKHKLKKLRKKMRFLWERLRLRRETRKEKVFKEELYAQIKEAESFNAEMYVADILHRINNKPHIETPAERRARIRELIKQNRSNVTFLRPDYDDIK